MNSNHKNRMKFFNHGITSFSIPSHKYNKAKLVFSSALLFLIMIACNSNEKNKTITKDINREANEVISKSKDYGSERWDDLNGNIHEFERHLEVTTKEAELMYKNLSGELQNQYEAQKKKLAEKKSELDKTLKGYQEASGEKRQELRSEVLKLKVELYKNISTFEEEMWESKKQALSN